MESRSRLPWCCYWYFVNHSAPNRNMNASRFSFFTTAMLSSGAVAVVVFANTPEDASAWMIRLFWLGLCISVWSWIALILSAISNSSGRVMISALFITIGAMAIIVLLRSGQSDLRLLGGVIFATLLGAISALRFRRLYGSTGTNQTSGA